MNINLISFQIYLKNDINDDKIIKSLTISINDDLTIYDLWILIKKTLNLENSTHYTIYNYEIFKKIVGIFSNKIDILSISILNKFNTFDFDPKYILFNSFYSSDFNNGPILIKELFNNTQYDLLLIKRNFDNNIITLLNKINNITRRFYIAYDLIKIDSIDLYLYCLAKDNNNYTFLKLASNHLKGIYKLVLKSVQKNGFSLKYAVLEHQNDFNIVYQAVTKDGRTLEHASQNLKNNFEIVLKAVEDNGLSLKYASENLKDNPTIVSVAIICIPWAFEYAGPKCKSIKQIVLSAVANYPSMIQFVDPKLLLDPLIIKITIIQDIDLLSHIDISLRSNKSFMTDILKINGLGLRYVDPSILDYDLVKIAVSNNGLSLKYANEFVQNKDIALIAIKENPRAFKYIGNNLVNNNNFNHLWTLQHQRNSNQEYDEYDSRHFRNY